VTQALCRDQRVVGTDGLSGSVKLGPHFASNSGSLFIKGKEAHRTQQKLLKSGRVLDRT
jgi:hypothetical protein